MRTILIILMTACSFLVYAEQSVFTKGPLIIDYGPKAQVDQTLVLDKDQKFKVAFDVAELGDVDRVNRKFESLARFLNMHVNEGIAKENIELALVVHGKASFGLIEDKYYQEKFKSNNPNKKLISALMDAKVTVILCGQSAAYYKISNKQLITGTEVALSAMTAHALLQQQGFTINPF